MRCIILLLLLCLEANATIYYADPATGNDANNGTSTGTPWAHIPGFVSSGGPTTVLQNGDKLVVKGGSVHNYGLYITSPGNNTGDAPPRYNGSAAFDSIVIQSGHLFSPQWGTTRAIIDAQNTRFYAVAFEQSKGVTLDGFELRNIAAGSSINGNGNACIEFVGIDHCAVKRCWLHDSTRPSQGIDDRGHGIECGRGGGLGQFFIFAQNEIGPNIGTKGIETVNLSYGAISNNYVHGTGDHGIVVDSPGTAMCTNVDVCNNLVYMNGLSSPYSWTYDHDPVYGIDLAGAYRCDIWNNVLFAPSPIPGTAACGIGVYAENDDNRFFQNTVAFCGSASNDGGDTAIRLGDSSLPVTLTTFMNNLCYKNYTHDGNIAWSILYPSTVSGENVQYSVFWGGASTTENVMSYRSGATDPGFPVSTFNPPTSGHTYANNVQMDPKLILGTLPTGLDTLYHPNQPYFSVSATTPAAVANTGHAVTGDSTHGWDHSAGKFALDIIGRTRTSYSMGAYESPTDPTITSNPTDQSVAVGFAATFTVGASGLSTLSYQWYTNGVSTANSGITASYTTPPTPDTSWNNIPVYVLVTDTAGTVQAPASPAHLFVSSGGAAPVVTSQPQSVSIATNKTATFTVTASGSLPLTYQWNLNGTNIPFATGPTLTTNNVPLAASGNSYTVGITNAFGGILSTPAAILTVTASVGINALNVGTMTVNRVHVGP